MINEKACEDQILCNVNIERTLELSFRKWSVRLFTSGLRKLYGSLCDVCR